MVRFSAFFVADGIYVQGNVFQSARFFKNGKESFYDYGVGNAVFFAENFQAKLLKLPTSSSLGLVVPEKRAVIIKHHGLWFALHAVFKISSYYRGRSLGPQNQFVASFCFQRIHFFFHDVSHFSHAGGEKLHFFQVRSSYGPKAVKFRYCPRFFYKFLLQEIFFAQNVLHSTRSSYGFFFCHIEIFKILKKYGSFVYRPQPQPCSAYDKAFFKWTPNARV